LRLLNTLLHIGKTSLTYRNYYIPKLEGSPTK
jgi:hypothetical protein